MPMAIVGALNVLTFLDSYLIKNKIMMQPWSDIRLHKIETNKIFERILKVEWKQNLLQKKTIKNNEWI